MFWVDRSSDRLCGDGEMQTVKRTEVDFRGGRRGLQKSQRFFNKTK